MFIDRFQLDDDKCLQIGLYRQIDLCRQTCIYIYTDMRFEDRQIDLDRQASIDRSFVDRSIDRPIDRLKLYRWMDRSRCMDRQLARLIDTQLAGLDRWMDGWMDGWMDRWIYLYTCDRDNLFMILGDHRHCPGKCLRWTGGTRAGSNAIVPR